MNAPRRLIEYVSDNWLEILLAVFVLVYSAKMVADVVREIAEGK